jgi:hypothetical protein
MAADWTGDIVGDVLTGSFTDDFVFDSGTFDVDVDFTGSFTAVAE